MIRSMKTLAAASMIAAMGTLGCSSGPSSQERVSNYVDPSWPERYSSVAREEVLAPFAAQATNGAIIDSTLWNYHFELGSAKLSPAGLEKLDYLARRRPGPETHVYLQTARDLAYDETNPDKLVATRTDIDAKRVESMKKYLATQAAAKGAAFEVTVIDPADPSIPARYPANAFNTLPSRYTSGVGGSGGSSSGTPNSGGGSSGGSR